jgi:hypothetical protein
VLSLSVKIAAVLRLKDVAHEGEVAASPARPWRRAQSGFGRDQDRDAVGGELVHLLGVPATAVRDHDLRQLADADGLQLASGRGDHRGEVAEVG